MEICEKSEHCLECPIFDETAEECTSAIDVEQVVHCNIESFIRKEKRKMKYYLIISEFTCAVLNRFCFQTKEEAIDYAEKTLRLSKDFYGIEEVEVFEREDR